MARSTALPMRLGVTMAAAALVTAGCGDGTGTGAGGDAGADGTAGTAGAGGGAGTDQTISIGAVPGWSDQTGTANLYKIVLEDQGYPVEITELTDNAPIFAGLAQGDIDVMGSAWPEFTHLAYWEEYGDNLEDIGVYYDNAALFLAVPEYSQATSIEDLPGMAEELDGRIVGIEPGAGLTRATEQDVMPAYGLEDSYQLVTSSTAAMLAELQSATDAQEEIVVTLWRPFWANLSFPVRPLEDPLGAYGEPEGLHTIARAGFTEDFPEVAEMMANFTLTDEQYGSLEDTMVNEYELDEGEAAVQDWLDENPEVMEGLTAYLPD